MYMCVIICYNMVRPVRVMRGEDVPDADTSFRVTGAVVVATDSDLVRAPTAIAEISHALTMGPAHHEDKVFRDVVDGHVVCG
jgi:hypothetical protein